MTTRLNPFSDRLQRLRRLGLAFLAFVFLLAGGGCAGSAQAQDFSREHIDRYDVSVDIGADGSLAIEESIRVFVLGDVFKRGIYRDFPLSSLEGWQPDNPYRSVAAFRDGQAENIARTEYTGGNYRIYLGQEDVFLTTNQYYTYTLRYRIDRGILQFDDSDNFDWNIIPHDWTVPIRNWRVTLNPPAGAELLGSRVLSGPRGTEGNPYNGVLTVADGGFTLSGDSLPAFAGVTLVLAFAPDMVAPGANYPVINGAYYAEQARLAEERAAAEAERRAREAERAQVAGIALLIAVLIFIALAILLWMRLGREKAVMPPVYPRFDPPQNVGAGAARFISRQGNISTIKMLITVLVSLSVKGYIRLEDKLITRLEDGGEALTPSEKMALSTLRLNRPDDTYVIVEKDTTTASELKKAAKAVVTEIRDEFRSTYRTNWFWSLGMIILLNLIWLTGFAASALDSIFAWAMLLLVLSVIAPIFSSVFRAAGKGWFWFILMPIFFIFQVGGFVLNVVGNADVQSLLSNIPVMLAFGLSTVALMMIPRHFKNYTQSGAEMAAELEGLKLYIKAAEHGELQEEPEPDYRRFSLIYPYAFALGLNAVWAGKFANEMASWAAAGAVVDPWYGMHHNRFEDNLDSFESGFQSAANYSPSSSSGSGGSSFSGGGGGGGGGGGW